MLFSLPKFPRFGSFTTVYQKKAHFCHLFAVFFQFFGPLQATLGPLSQLNSVIQHTIIFSILRVSENQRFLEYILKKQLIPVSFLSFFLYFFGPLQASQPFILKACILAYNNIFYINFTENLMFLCYIPKKQLVLVIPKLFLVVFWAPTAQPRAPLIFKACILAYNNIFFIIVPKIWMLFHCIPKNSLFQLFFCFFWGFLWVSTVQSGAPFIFKACILAYNNIFFIEIPKNWMYLDCVPTKYLILIVFQLFLVVFQAPTDHPGALFLFKACILAYNNIFFIKIPKNRMFLDCIPKKHLILVVFQLFLVVFWAPRGQPGAPFLFKACILACNNIFFITVPKNPMFLDCIPKKQVILVVFWLFLAVFFVTFWSVDFFLPKTTLVA